MFHCISTSFDQSTLRYCIPPSMVFYRTEKALQPCVLSTAFPQGIVAGYASHGSDPSGGRPQDSS